MGTATLGDTVGATASVIAACQNNERLIGGGGGVTGSQASLRESLPQSVGVGGTWRVNAVNNAATSGGVVTAYAICAT